MSKIKKKMKKSNYWVITFTLLLFNDKNSFNLLVKIIKFNTISLTGINKL